MGRLIDDLLSLSRVIRSDFQRQDVDLTAIALNATARLRRDHPERQVAVAIAQDLFAEGDVRLLTIALENLIGNAWKFSGRRANARIEVGVRDDAGRRAYLVRDNGAGFDMTYASKLFGVFQRLHSNSEFEGTGIGLATVQRIVHRHGGRIWAEGQVEQGATFFFTLEEDPPANRQPSA
jgi:light-regulated signal transduction histidine kinase (bacteriophytochrome)